MVLKEIRKDVEDTKGRVHSNKLICKTVYKDDSIAIEISGRNYKEPVTIDVITEILASDLDKISLENFKHNIMFPYLRRTEWHWKCYRN